MAKKIKRLIKIQAPAGKATPAPPLGTQLGPTGINIGDFCSKFNEATKDKGNEIVPAVISIYEDRTFTFVLKTPPASFLLKKAAGIEKGASSASGKMAGKITKQQLREIAERKMQDLNVADIEGAERVIIGTAKSMRIGIGD